MLYGCSPKVDMMASRKEVEYNRTQKLGGVISFIAYIHESVALGDVRQSVANPSRPLRLADQKHFILSINTRFIRCVETSMQDALPAMRQKHRIASQTLGSAYDEPETRNYPKKNRTENTYSHFQTYQNNIEDTHAGVKPTCTPFFEQTVNVKPSVHGLLSLPINSLNS
jgi:hypothetical protein